MATQTNTEYFTKLDELYASTPKLPLGDPDAPLIQYPETGDVRVKDSRIQLHLILESYLEENATLEDLDKRYSSLTIDDLAKIIDYYERNKEIVEEYLAHTKVICDFNMEQLEKEFPQQGVLDRLKARLNNGGPKSE